VAIPILQTITPDVANPGLRVRCTGFNLDSGDVVLQINGGTVVEPSASSTDTELEFIVPYSSASGKGEVRIQNGDGTSRALTFVITDDPMLGFTVCLPGKTADEYRDQSIQLQPEGRPWSLNPLSNWMKLMGAVCEEIARVRARACELRTELVPSKTVNLLPDFETELGLPEPCNLNAPTDFESRRDEVVRKTAAVGGNSIEYYRSLAAKLGVEVVIYEDTGTESFLCGRNVSGDAINGTIFLFTWYVEVQNYTVNVFQCGQNQSGTPLRWWGAEELECFFNILKQSHTNVVIKFADQDWICTPDSGEIIVSNASDGDIIVNVPEV